MHKNNKILFLIVLLCSLLVMVPLSQTQAQSTDYTLLSVSGVWSAVQPAGMSGVTGVGTDTVRWGGTTGYGKSGLRFNNTGVQNFNEGDPFQLGGLTHINFPIFPPSASGATLKITLTFQEPEITPNPVFYFDFDIEETTNTSPCPSWHTPGNPACDDRITFPQSYGEEEFLIGDKIYTLKIEGFVDSFPGGSPVEEYITREYTENNNAILVGSLTSILVPEPDIRITKKTNDVIVTEAPGLYLYENDPVEWKYVIQNTGNTTLTNIAVIDDVIGAISCPATELEPGANMTCTASGIVALGQYTNTATVTGTYTGGTVTDDATSWYFGIAPAIQLIKAVSPASYDELNDTLLYSFTVKNTGNVVLTDITVTDPFLGLTFGPTTLNALATQTFTHTYHVTQADLNAGVIENTAYVTGKDPNGVSYTDSAQAVASGIQHFELSLKKSADVANYDSVGDIIQYEYTLKNTGNVTLYPPYTVDDDQISVSCPSSPSALNPGSSVICTASYTIGQSDLDEGSVVNIATGNARNSAGGTVTSLPDSQIVTALQSKTLLLDKTAAPLTYAAVGDPISYDYDLTNTGNITLYPPYAVNDDSVTVFCPALPVTLPPGASVTCTASTLITQADLDAGSLTNHATGTAKDAIGAPISSNPDQATVTAVQTPELTLEKSALPETYQTVGETISYQYLLTNSGNVTLSQPFSVSDDQVAVSCPATPTTVAPGGTLTCTASYLITQADLDRGSLTNIATASGKDPGGNPVSSNQDSETVTAVRSFALGLQKSASPMVYSQVGQSILYTYQLTNEGNVTLFAPYSVADNKVSVSCPSSPASLAPGERVDCTATYNITQGDLNVGSVVNVATAKAEDGQGGDVSSLPDSVTIDAAQTRALLLEKTAAPLTYASLGETISYTYLLTNNGNVTLFAPYGVMDDQVSVTCSQTPAQLLPGESVSCSATHLINQIDLNNGSLTNHATADARDLSGDPVYSNPDSATITAVQSVDLSLAKSASPNTYANLAEVIQYTYQLQNDGNVTLYAPFTVTDSRISVTCPPGISSLAPGDTLTCTASYMITQADLDQGSVFNTAIARALDPTGGSVDSNYDSETITATQLRSLLLTKSANPLTYSALNETIQYTYTLTNTSNITLYPPYAVSDDKLTVSCPSIPNTLAPNNSVVCTATHTITQADLDNGSIINNAYGQARYSETESVRSNNDTATVTAAQSASINLTKTASPLTYDTLGETITYTITVQNTGNVTLSSVVVTDSKASSGPTYVSGDTNGNSLLDLGETWTYTASLTVSQAHLDSGSIANTASVSALDPNSDTVTDTDSATVTAVQSPSMPLDKTPDRSTYASVGEVITYTFTVTNTGNVTLSNIRIDDPLTGSTELALIPASLAPGETGSVTATYTVTQADLDRGSIDNTAVATGTFDGVDYTASDTATVTGPTANPALSLQKSPDPDAYLHVGDVITYTFTVQNIGNVTLTNLIIDDPLTNSVGLSVTPPSLTPGAIGTASATYTIAQADLDAGKVTNTATATGLFKGVEYTASDSAEVSGPKQEPAISLIKSASPDTYNQTGETITYSFTVKNEGNVTLTGVTISDPLLVSSPISVTPSTLLPGESGTASGTYVTMQSDIDLGKIDNTATVTGYDPTNAPVTAAADATVTGPLGAPAITLDKSANPTIYTLPGNLITYTFTVTNTGNVTLSNVTVSDALFSWTFGPVTLAPGASQTFTETHTITTADISNETITNTATATGYYMSQTVEASDTETITFSAQPSISLEKAAAPQTYSQAGNLITYSFTVTNTGNVPLTNVTIADAMLSASAIIVNPATLQPGHQGTASVTYTIQEADVLAESLKNTATVTGYFNGTGYSDVAEETITVFIDPRISLTKSPSPLTYTVPGNVITYTFTVTNTGNVTMTDVTVSDALTGSVNLLISPSTLNPGESGTASATYTITSADIDNQSVYNLATATAMFGGQAYTAEADATVSYIADPSISLSKSPSPATFVHAGEVITYTFTVTNTGNVPVSDLVINDAMTGSVDLPVSPSTLLPGESGTASATYTISDSDILLRSIPNQATATGYYDGSPVSATGDATISNGALPGISLLKSASPQVFVNAGDVITYTFTVTNVGNVTITDITIDDPLTGTSGLAVSPSTLGQGESGVATAQYVITEDDVAAKTVTNTATATGYHQGTAYSATDNETVGTEPPKPTPEPTKQSTRSPERAPATGSSDNPRIIIVTGLSALALSAFFVLLWRKTRLN